MRVGSFDRDGGLMLFLAELQPPDKQGSSRIDIGEVGKIDDDVATARSLGEIVDPPQHAMNFRAAPISFEPIAMTRAVGFIVDDRRIGNLFGCGQA